MRTPSIQFGYIQRHTQAGPTAPPLKAVERMLRLTGGDHVIVVEKKTALIADETQPSAGGDKKTLRALKGLQERRDNTKSLWERSPSDRQLQAQAQSAQWKFDFAYQRLLS